MAHKFVIKKTDGGEYRAYFMYNSEKIFWTETYSSKSSATDAISPKMGLSSRSLQSTNTQARAKASRRS